MDQPLCTMNITRKFFSLIARTMAFFQKLLYEQPCMFLDNKIIFPKYKLLKTLGAQVKRAVRDSHAWAYNREYMCINAYYRKKGENN